MKCRDCDEQISERRKCGLCIICYSRDYKKRNKDKIKPVKHKQYLKRRDYWLRKTKEWNQKNGYSSDKRPERRDAANIRRATRRNYPLEENTCQFCNSKAEHHHHTTIPIEVDKFLFLCKKHHDETHGKHDAILGQGDGGSK
jgi:hypothetical protein